MFCESCGHEVESGDKFCPHCGKLVAAGQETEQETEQEVKRETGQEDTIYLGNEVQQEEHPGTPEILSADEKSKIEKEGYTEDINNTVSIKNMDNTDNIYIEPYQPVQQEQKKWPGRLLTGLLLTAVVVLAVNIAVGIIYLRQLESQDDNYELPDINVTESDDSNI